MSEENWLEIEDLEKDEKHYTFSEECLPRLRNATKVILLTEHLLAEKNAGKARKCPKIIANALQTEVGKYLDEDGILLSEMTVGTNWSDSDSHILSEWTARAIKQKEKKLIKRENCGVNLTNIPFAAGPAEIVSFVRRILEDEEGDNPVKAMDPWWAKRGWVHDGGCTVYLKKSDAFRLLETGKENPIFDPNIPALNRKVTITPGADGKLKTRVEADPYDL